MAAQVIQVGTAHANLSPGVFQMYARQYLECHRAYKPTAGYSPVPYFLLCRAIELALKACHLETMSRKNVKAKYAHNLAKLYGDLPVSARILDASEEALLVAATEKYNVPNKGFEYVSLYDALTGQKSFPDLAALEALAVKFVK